MKVAIDPGAGFCFGVEKAISMAEAELSEGGSLYCLDDLVHNREELTRLKDKGLTVISREQFREMKGEKVLFRAHGEPPDTYRQAEDAGIQIVDGTCPIVRKLQERIAGVAAQEKEAQIVIFGKKGHPEVTGLQGHVNGRAIIVQGEDELGEIDFSKPVRLYSQTTMSAEAYEAIAGRIGEKMQQAGNPDFVMNKSFCRQVSGRAAGLRAFASGNDVVVFASDRKSANGAYLYRICLEVNPRSYFIGSMDEIRAEWFSGCQSAGVTGATSTPRWFLEKVKTHLESLP